MANTKKTKSQKNSGGYAMQLTNVLPRKAKTNGIDLKKYNQDLTKLSTTPTVLEGFRKKVFMDRYSLKDVDGNPTEDGPEQMWQRVARGIAEVEKTPAQKEHWAREFYKIMDGFKFVPAGRILSGAGTGYEVTFFNCYVIPSPKDSRGGIMENIMHTVEIQSRAGGVGVNLSSLRPNGARVRKVNGTSSGPVNWASLYSVANHDVIQQGGCFAGDTMIMTHLGLVPITEIIHSKREWFAATHEGYQPITTKFDNGIKDVYEVKTKSGYKVKVTADHKMLTFDKNGDFYQKRLGEFSEGEYLTLLLGNWREDIPYAVLNTTLPEVSKFSYGRVKINLPQYLDEKLAYIIGVYDADGSKVTDEFSPNGKGLRISLAQNQPRDLAKICESLKEVFGVEAKVSQGDGAVDIVSVYSREINEFLVLNGLLKQSSNTVEVPSLIFNSPRSVVEAYIAGVFVGDGSNRGGKGGLRICTVSEKYASQLQLLLLNLGIAARISVQQRAEWRPLYTVSVNGNRFMKKLQNILRGYTQKVEDNSMSVRDGAFNWPFNLVEKFTYLSGFQRTIARTNPSTSYKAVAMLESSIPIIRDEHKRDIGYLASCVPDQIVSITKIGEEHTYDVEVGSTHLLSGNGYYTSNSRRGALMIMLHDWHPDVLEFIHVKEDLTKIPGANLSVCVSDKFMEAVEKDAEWVTKFPDTTDPEYDELWDGDIEGWEALGKPVKTYNTYKARDVWDQICTAAWRSAEPGIHFLERSNKWGNTWYFEKLLSTNPCLTGDSLVATATGWKRVDQIKEGERIATVYGSGLVERVETYENRPVFRVKFSDGSQLRATEAHQFHAIKAGDRAKNSANKRFKEIQLKDLVVGDVVRVAGVSMPDNAVADLPEGWSERDYGFFVGMLVGDGCITPKSLNRNVVKVAVNIGEKEWVEQIRNVLQKTGSKVVSTSLGQGLSANLVVQSPDGAAMMVKQSMLKPGYSYEKCIPLEYQNSNRNFLIGLLDGLFSTDGNVNLTSTHPALRFKTTSKQLALDLRRILLSFGIHGRIAAIKNVKDGLIEGRVIHSKHDQYEVIISGMGVKTFADQVTLSHPDKQKKLRIAQKEFALTGNTWLTRITSIEFDGFEKVYDLYEPESDTWISEGIVSRGCGEQPLGKWAVCNLGAMNLAAYVKEDGSFDYENLDQHVRVAMRFMDNVVDANFYFYKENEEAALDIRRTGIGTMGLGDTLIKMKIPYGSDDSIAVIERIYKTIRDAAYETSSDLAKEKGSFPKFDAEKYLQGHFIQSLPEEIRAKIKKQGIRNAVILTQAPTGTTSLVSGVSSGIEPVYDFAMIRKDRTGERILYHPLYEEWKNANPGVEKAPAYFVGANDLTPDDHMKVQATIQKYTDSSISKTVNAPTTHTVDDVKKLYMDAYKLGCKGISYMRDGSRAGVLTHVKDEKKEEKKEEAKPVQPPMHRPLILRGRTYKIQTPVGEGFVTINRDEQDQPFEVFVNIGKGGMHTMADAEALGRLVSLSLRLSRANGEVNPKSVADKIVSQLRGIGGGSHVGFGKARVMSLADAIAKVLAEDMAQSERETGRDDISPEALPLNLSVSEPKTEDMKQEQEKQQEVVGEQLTLSVPNAEARKSADLCPECGDAAFVREEGCMKCYSCGYSKC